MTIHKTVTSELRSNIAAAAENSGRNRPEIAGASAGLSIRMIVGGQSFCSLLIWRLELDSMMFDAAAMFINCAFVLTQIELFSISGSPSLLYLTSIPLTKAL